MRNLSAVLVFASSLIASMACLARDFPDAKRIVFLGDSITYSGGYIEAIEAALLFQYPERRIELLNLGLPSETTSGLSEPGHADGNFPRPDLHERLARVLEQTKPDLVVACYGMNDGMYYPQSQERFAKFQSGIERLHRMVELSNAKIVHLTPAHFDAQPIRERLLPAGLQEYRSPFAGYDNVLEDYSTWLLSRKDIAWQVIDVHGAMKAELAKRRLADSDYCFAKDGVHPNAEGQAIIAQVIADAWGLRLEGEFTSHPRAAEIRALIREKQSILKHAWLTATRHLRPGIAAGQPLEEAQSKAIALDERMRNILRDR